MNDDSFRHNILNSGNKNINTYLELKTVQIFTPTVSKAVVWVSANVLS
jgi:hypothetical protein